MTLAEAVETIKKYCKGRTCDECAFLEIDEEGEEVCKLLTDSPCYWVKPAETNIYDQEEIHENCTVQILRNSVTGEESIGWWEND